MRTLFTLCSIILLNLNVQAQTAKEWMDKMRQTYLKIPTYYIKFEVKESDNSKVESGELFAAKEKYSLEVMDIKQMYDGKTLYTISKEDKEVTISVPPADSDDFLTPTKVVNMYKNGFSLSLGKTETIHGKKIQFIKLTPTSKNDADYMLVGINTADNTIYQYKEIYKNGTTRTVTVKEFIQNLIIPRALFKFDKSKYEKDGYIVTSI